MECNGFWEICQCEDCIRVSGLYSYLEWLEEMDPDNIDEIYTVKKEILDMGYSV